VLSIIGILVVGILSIGTKVADHQIVSFQMTVTYVTAASLIFSGTVQLAFTRYIADRLYENHPESILPSFNGMLLIVTMASAIVGMPVIFFLFPEQSILYRLLLLSAFILMCAIWVSAVFLSGMKMYKQIIGLFALGYTIVVMLSLLLREYGVEGLMMGFIIGHYVLLIGMIFLTYFHYQSDRLISFDFFKPGAMFVSLMLAGLFYNSGIWADKILFWYNVNLSQEVIGPLRRSIIYDFPIFLSYLSLIPGMAVFLVRIETDFVEYYMEFYSNVRDGASLDAIEKSRNRMAMAARQGLFDIAKLQAIVILAVIAIGAEILDWIGISQSYLSLLQIDVVSASMQVLLLGILNIMFYLDRRHMVVWVTLLFLISNIIFTMLSQSLGTAYYGYGYAFSLLLTVSVGLVLLNRHFNQLEYKTFM